MSMDKDFINASKPLHNPSVNDSQIFIKGNAPDIKKEGKKKPLTKIFSFSLPVTYEEKLDEMVLRARHPKINRSALMRVAMEELEKYPDDKLQEVIANYFKNDLENN